MELPLLPLQIVILTVNQINSKDSKLYFADLYLYGIQRESFLPCIEHIKRHMTVINLSSEQDFRTIAKKDKSVSELFLPFQTICENVQSLQLSVDGRHITIPAGAIGVACEFEFQQLFGEAHSAAEYIALCKSFPRIFVKALPAVLDDSMRNEIRRFIIFVDIAYESRVLL